MGTLDELTSPLGDLDRQLVPPSGSYGMSQSRSTVLTALRFGFRSDSNYRHSFSMVPGTRFLSFFAPNVLT